MSEFISKIDGVKSYKDRHRSTMIDTFNSDKDVYFNARKIPIKKLLVKTVDAMDSKLIIDSKYLSKPESRVSVEKLWDFFKNSKKIRFFTSIQDTNNLISCTFESGLISVFVNCQQNLYSNSKNNQKRCFDSSIIRINQDIHRIVSPELNALIDQLQLFFNNYQEFLKNNKIGNFKNTPIQKHSFFSQMLLKFVNFFNIPSVDKFLIVLDNESHLNDASFESFAFQGMSIEIQSIYP
jgi:hypothetical protein